MPACRWKILSVRETNVLWTLATDIDGFAYSVQRMSFDDGPESFTEFLGQFSEWDDVIYVFDLVPPSFEKGLPGFNRMRRTLAARLDRIMAALLLSNMHDRYKTVVVCSGFEDEDELEVLERDGLKVISTEGILELIRQAGGDRERLDMFYDVMRAYSYTKTLDDIYRFVLYAIAERYSLLDNVSMLDRLLFVDVDIPVSIVGDRSALLLGLVEEPDLSVLDDQKRMVNIEHMSRAAHIEYENRNEQFEGILSQLTSFWKHNAASFARRYHDEHPDFEGEIEIDVDEIVSSMLLAHAKEAYDAGVPIEDILC